MTYQPDPKNNDIPEFEKIYSQENVDKEYRRLGETFIDMMSNIILGTAQSIEGIYDTALTSVGLVGGMFNPDIKMTMEEKIRKSHTADIQKYLSQYYDESFLYDAGKSGDLLRQTAQGVGQMLPALATMGIASGLGASPKIASIFSQSAFFAQAMGSGVQQGLEEGASFDQAATYGAMSGTVELLTERIVGGGSTNIFGKGMVDNAIQKQASSKLFKLAFDTIGEGFEEALAEIVNPLLKRATYDKNAEFWTPEHRQAIVESFIVGGLTNLAYGQTFGKIRTQASRNVEEVSDLNSMQSKRERLYVRGKDTNVLEGEIDTQGKTISDRLVKMSDSQRARYIKSYGLENTFNADGTYIVNKDRAAITPSLYNAKLPNVKIAESVSETQTQVLRLGAKMKQKVVIAELANINDIKVDGYFDPDTQTIVINSKADNPSTVYVHELTHKLEGTKQFSQFASYILDNYEFNPILKARFKRSDIENSVKALYNNKELKKVTNEYIQATEFIAKYTSEVLFKDEASINKLAEENTPIFKRIHQWIKQKISQVKGEQLSEAETDFKAILTKAEKLYKKAIQKEVGGVRISDIEDSAEDNRYSRSDLRKESIRKALANKLISSESVFLDFTPVFLQKLGLDNNPVTLTQDHLEKIIITPKNSYKGEHAIPLSYIENDLINDLNEPMIVFDLGNDRVGIMTDSLDVDGSPIYLPIKYTANSIINDVNIDANHITTIYGRDEFQKYIQDNLSKIIYIDKVKTSDLFRRSGNTYPNHLNVLVSKTILQQVGTNVNINEGVRDSDGDLLTNDQVEFYKNVHEELKDSNGNLMVLYHQTDAEFTEFKLNRKEGAGYRDDLMPIGIFLKDSSNDIGLKGKNQLQLYARIENPLVVENREALNAVVNEVHMIKVVETKIANIDEDYSKLVDDASERAFKRSDELNLPELDRTEVDKLFVEWNNAGTELSQLRKKLITNYLKKQGYDGLVVKNDKGSFGRKVKSFIAFETNQVKRIDNAKPSDSKDIRFSYSLDEDQKRILSKADIIEFSFNKDKSGYNIQVINVDGNMEYDGTSISMDDVYDTFGDEIGKHVKKNASLEVAKIYKSEIKSFVGSNINNQDYSNIVNEAKIHYGVTSSISKAAYINIDGTLLDFSDRQGHRVLDHRDISEIMDIPGGDAMYKYIELGNIRIMPENGGIELAKMPSPEQLSAIRRYVNHFKGEVFIDMWPSGEESFNDSWNLQSVEYDERTASAKIISDITEFYNQSNDSDIRYSLAEIKEKYKDYTDNVWMYEKDNYIKLDTIRIKKELRKQGIGTQFMNDLIGYADQEGKIIGLTPSDAFGASSIARLREFYRRFGFKPNKSHMQYMETMIREPKETESTDNEGRKLSIQQKEYFKNSKALNQQGRLEVVYHGTRDFGFSTFKDIRGSDYGLVAYFTNNRKIAETYAYSNNSVYEGYLNIEKPFIVDAQGDRYSWIRNATITDSMDVHTANVWKNMIKETQGNPTSTATISAVVALYIKENPGSFDGVIIKNLKDEAFSHKGTVNSTIYLMMNANSFKLTENKKPTKNNDIRFSLDSEGKRLTAEQIEHHKDTVALDSNGNLQVLYHGSTETNINIFDTELSGKSTGVPEKLVYFTTDKETAEQFGSEKEPTSSKYINKLTGIVGRIYEVYLNITSPLNLNRPDNSDIQFLKDAYQKEFGLGFKDAERYVNNAIEKGNNQLLKIMITADNLRDAGYDGIIAKMYMGKDILEYGVLEPNQIKSVDNLKPTSDVDIRYSKKSVDPNDPDVIREDSKNLNDTNPKKEQEKINSALKNLQKSETKPRTLSEGQELKNKARLEKDKTYSKTDAEKVVNTILGDYMVFNNYDGDISQKTKEQVIEDLWLALNSLHEGERAAAALNIANYIIENAIAEDIYMNEMNKADAEYIAAVRDFKHAIDLSTFKDEIRNVYGKVNTPFLMWGKRKGSKSINMGDVISELNDRGIQIEGSTEAEQFINFVKRYHMAKDNLKQETKSLKSELSKEEHLELKNSIVREVLSAWDNYGKATPFNKEITKYQELLKDMKTRLKDARQISFAISKMFKTIDRVSALEKYQSVEDIPLSKEIVSAVKLLRNIKTWRGNLASANSVREIFKKYMAEVDDGNGKKIPLYELYHKLENSDTFGDSPYGELIKGLATGEGILNVDDFNAIDQILENFIHNVRSYDRVFFENKDQSLKELVDIAISETGSMIPMPNGMLTQYKNWNISSVWIFERLSNFRKDGYFSKLFYELHQGVNKQSAFKRDAANHYAKFFEEHRSTVNTWREQNSEIAGIKVSRGQLISLYLLAQRTQAKHHLFNIDENNGTIRISDEKLASKKLFKDADRQGVDVSITTDDIKNVTFSNTERKFIELTQSFFNQVARDAKVETDVALFGVTNVDEDNYFPIRVSNDVLVKNIGDASAEFTDLFSVYNASFNKNVRRNAKNKVIVENVLDVVEKHTQQMSAYYGLAIPIKMFNKVMNKKTENGDHLFGKVYKKAPMFERYITKLLKDIQGVRSESSTFDRVLGKIRGYWARAALGLNPKVWTTQFASLVSAGGVGIEYRHLIKGLSKAFVRKTDYDTLYKYSSMLYDRAREGNNIDVGLLKQDVGTLGKLDWVTNATTKPIGIIDKLVVGAVWNAALDSTKNKYTPNSIEHYQAAAKLTEEAVIRTQANWSPLYRPQILREHSSALSMITMFMSEPLQVFSQIAGSIEKLKIARQLNDAKLIKEASSEARRYALSISMNAIFLVMVGMAFKWVKFGTDDEEEWWEQMLIELGAHFVGMLPIVRDIYSQFQGYELSNMYETGLTNIYNGLESIVSVVEGGILGNKPYDKKDFFKDGRRLTFGLSQTLGVPVRNLETYFFGILEKFDEGLVYKYRDKYRTQNYSSDLQKALENEDDDLADTIIDLMLEDRKISIKEQKVNTEVARLYKLGNAVLPRAVPKSIEIDDEIVKLTNRQYKKFQETYNQADDEVTKLVNSVTYITMNDRAKARAIKFIYDYYYNMAKEELTGEDYTGKIGFMAKAIDIHKLAAIYAVAQVTEADTTRSGQIISGSKKAKISSMLIQYRLTSSQRALIMAYLGYSIDNSGAIKILMNQYGLTSEEKAILETILT